MFKPGRKAAILGAGVALVSCATFGVAAAAPRTAARTLTYYAFDINNGTTDPGLIPVAGTSPKVFSQGDELIINDQITSTHKTKAGYPIVGRDSGVCTLTRIPEKYADQTLANCVVTVVWKNGTLAVQGVVQFRSQLPQTAVLAITGGTGRFLGAAGTIRVGFTKDYKILVIRLK
jgi:Dirigent-like protein